MRYSASQSYGVQSLALFRNAVGYVVKGNKYIHLGDRRYEIRCGEIFFLPAGTHYVEDACDESRQFEQLVFYYSPDTINDLLSILCVDFGLEVTSSHRCEKCELNDHAVSPSWPAVRSFFDSASQYLREDAFADNRCLERLKTAELLCLIMNREDCCIKSKLLIGTDSGKESLERVVQMHIFEDISIDKLAERCGRSLTSFKKDFSRRFHDSPHRWITRQRLTHARMLLISTEKTVARIGAECGFHNTSHFIKLFRSEYNHTPAAYRNKSRREGEPHPNIKGSQHNSKMTERPLRSKRRGGKPRSNRKDGKPYPKKYKEVVF